MSGEHCAAARSERVVGVAMMQHSGRQLPGTRVTVLICNRYSRERTMRLMSVLSASRSVQNASAER